jgi:hypothetical protein
MTVAVARVPTVHASRYLQQLCKHWGHKYPVVCTPENGRIEMSAGVLLMDADADGLGLHLAAEAPELERMQDVVADHLQRFAFRETLAFDWKPG